MILTLFFCSVSASTDIITPWFDLPDVVPLESGRYRIQSAEPGPYYDLYLSSSEFAVAAPFLTTSVGLSTAAAASCLMLADMYDPEGIFVSTLTGAACLFATCTLLPVTAATLVSLRHAKTMKLSALAKTSWRVELTTDQISFFLKFETPFVSGLYLPFGEFVAVKANEDGDVYLKALWNGKRSKWLHGHRKIGFRSRGPWKWKLTLL